MKPSKSVDGIVEEITQLFPACENVGDPVVLMYVARPDDSKEYSWTHGPNPSLEALLEDLPNGYFVTGLIDRGSVCDRVCYAQWVDGKLQPIDW